MNLEAHYHITISEQENGKFVALILINGIHGWLGTERENERDAMLEATCFLTSQYQKPNET